MAEGRHITRLTEDQMVQIGRLADGTKTRAEISDEVGIPDGTVQYAIGRLRKAGATLELRGGRSGSQVWEAAANILKNGGSTAQ